LLITFHTIAKRIALAELKRMQLAWLQFNSKTSDVCLCSTIWIM